MDEHPLDHPFVDSDVVSDEDLDESRTRRRWPIVVVSLVVVIVAIGVALYIAASHYQPFALNLEGNYGAEVLTSNGSLAASKVVGGLGATRMIWTEPSGSFRVETVVTLNNDQRFGVTVDKVLPPPNPSGTSDAHTYFDSKGVDEGFYGYKGGPEFKPSSLASGGSLTLVVHWNQQCVPASAQSAVTTYTWVPVEYSFMGFRHTVDVRIGDLSIQPRQTC
jgi:hypothetical protein